MANDDSIQRFQQLLQVAANPEQRTAKATELAARMAPPPMELLMQLVQQPPVPQGMQRQGQAAPAQAPAAPLQPVQAAPQATPAPVQNPTNPNAQLSLAQLLPKV